MLICQLTVGRLLVDMSESSVSESSVTVFRPACKTSHQPPRALAVVELLENGNSINRWSLGAQLQNMALCRIGESNPKGVNSIRRMWNPFHLQHTITMSNDLRIKQKTKIFLYCIQKSKTVLQMTCCKIKNQVKHHDRMMLPDQYFAQSIQPAKHHKIFVLTF